MKSKLTKGAAVVSLTLAFIVGSVNEANAWKFFGKEVTGETAVNELVCGSGCTGVQYTYVVYAFGIPVNRGQEVICICPGG